MVAPFPGHATPEATDSYARRLADRLAGGHERRMAGLALSSIGLGTYLGDADGLTDAGYQAAILRAFQLGINVVDTASNYRHQRSERAVGRALHEAVESAVVTRDEVVLASKAGFLAFDDVRPSDPAQYIDEVYVDTGLMTREEIVAGCHSLAPRYLRHQIEQSRRNLGVDTIDVYYLHNPETQLDEVARDVVMGRLRAAIEALEQARRDGAIVRYGAATWTALRVPPHHPGHLSLAALVALAESVGGADHGFRVVQLPYNLAMPEARVMATQEVGGRQMPALDAALVLGLYVMASASIEQGKLAARLPRGAAESDDGLRTPAQRALQYARSAPGIGTALVGMKTAAHVDENAEILRIAPAG